MSIFTRLEDRFGKIDWVSTTFIFTYHIALFVALPLYLMASAPAMGLIGWTVGLAVISLLSITAGYHRLYAHRTYNTRKGVEFFLLLFGTSTAQGSVLRWAHDHRLHHRHLDGEKDPYGTDKGFWHSHLLWMLKDQVPLEDRYLADLRQNKMLVIQHKYYALWLTVTNLAIIGALGWLTGDWIGAFVIGFLARTFFVHHATWFINSLAHMWGSKPYSTEHSAVNNFILAVLTLGEGYHNYHHTFAGDYRNGIRWYQFDPPKYLIWAMSKLGLAWDLKTTDPLMIRKKLVQADKKLLIEHLSSIPHEESSVFAEAVEKMSEKLSSSMMTAKSIMDKYRSLDRKKHHIEIREMRGRLRELRQSLGQDWKTWRRLTRLVLKMQPAVA